MCGIAALFGSTASTDSDFQTILETLRHRGPDDEGIWRGPRGRLGHTRLSILDLEGGHQPLVAPSTDVGLVSNGEIYNHQAIRERFHDYPFQTTTDAEVLLPLHGSEGPSMVRHLDGMFSFLLMKGDEMVVARDPLGIKPLYQADWKGGILLASEIKAFPEDAKGLKEFPNGHVWSSRDGWARYYQPNTLVKDFPEDPGEASSLLFQSLERAVQKRLMADVPVGTFLSGGLDSSIIAALMCRHVEHPHSFAVGVKDSEDLQAARWMASHLQTRHHELVFSHKDLINILPEVIYHLESFDPALVRSALPCFLVSRLASQEVKVVLSGEGADELFGGYSYMADIQDGPTLQAACLEALEGLHDMNLQRVDRMTMAHGLEGRVPFLDVDFVAHALSVPPEWRLQDAFGMEKGFLRKTFESLLPKSVAWRTKKEFAEGSGSSQWMARHAREVVSDADFQRANGESSHEITHEEVLYRRIFRECFPNRGAESLVARWRGKLH